MVQELSTLIVSLHNIIEKPKAGNPGFVASKNSSKANFYMLVLSKQSIRRRGIRVSSKEYENLVTLRKGTAPCAVYKWTARPAWNVGYISVAKKKHATQLWLLLTASECDFSWIPLFIFQHVSVTGPLKCFFTLWPPRIKRMLNVAYYICCSVLNWVLLELSPTSTA